MSVEAQPDCSKVSSSNHGILHACQRKLTGCLLPFYSEISEEAERTKRRASTKWKAMVSIFCEIALTYSSLSVEFYRVHSMNV